MDQLPNIIPPPPGTAIGPPPPPGHGVVELPPRQQHMAAGGPNPTGGHGGGKGVPGANGQQMFVTEYRGWTLRRAEPEPGQRYDWTRINKFEFPVSIKDMAIRAKQSRNKRPVLDVYDSLRLDSQRAHIDRLIEDQNRLETNLFTEWKLANIEAIVRKIPGLLGSKDRIIETNQIRVILKKVARTTPRRPGAKPLGPHGFAGETIDLHEPPPIPNIPNVPKMQAEGPMGGRGPMGPGPGPGPGPGSLPPPPRALGGRGSMEKMPPRGVLHGGKNDRGRSRSRSAGPRTSSEKLNKVIKYLDRLGIGDSDSESGDSIVEIDDRRARRKPSKFKIRPPPLGSNRRPRSRSPYKRRDSSSSFEIIDNVSSASSGSYTDATPPLSTGSGRYARRYFERSRSRSRGRFRNHRKPPSYPLPLPEPVVNYNFFGDSKLPRYVRRHSDDDQPYGLRSPSNALPLAPEAPGYGYPRLASRAQSYMDDTSRRATYTGTGDGMRPVLDAYQKGREEERRASLEARVQELRRQEAASMRRIDSLRRVEDGTRYRRPSERSLSPREREYSTFSRR